MRSRSTWRALNERMTAFGRHWQRSRVSRRAFSGEELALMSLIGTPLALDLCSITQKDKRYYSFLSQAFGLMADLGESVNGREGLTMALTHLNTRPPQTDLGTEHLRWMGDTRFTVGYVQGALTRRTYPVELAVKIAPNGSDKAFLAKEYNNALTRPPPPIDEDETGAERGIPQLKFGTAEDELPKEARGRVHVDLPERLEEGWHTLRTDVQFVYGGKLPFVAKDVSRLTDSELSSFAEADATLSHTGQALPSCIR